MRCARTRQKQEVRSRAERARRLSLRTQRRTPPASMSTDAHAVPNSIKADAERLLAGSASGEPPSGVAVAVGTALKTLAAHAAGEWPEHVADVRAAADGLLTVVAESEAMEAASFERIRQAESSRDGATAALGQLAAALQDATADHALLARIEALETQGANTSVKLDRLSAENASLRSDNAELRSAVAKLTADNTSLKSEVARLLAFVDSLQQSMAGEAAAAAAAGGASAAGAE